MKYSKGSCSWHESGEPCPVAPETLDMTPLVEAMPIGHSRARSGIVEDSALARGCPRWCVPLSNSPGPESQDCLWKGGATAGRSGKTQRDQVTPGKGQGRILTPRNVQVFSQTRSAVGRRNRGREKGVLRISPREGQGYRETNKKL